MLTEQDFKRIENQTIELYGDLELEIIEEIAERIANVGYANTVAYNNAIIMEQMGYLYDDVIKEIAKYNEINVSKIRAIFEEAGIKSLKRDYSIYKLAGIDPHEISSAMKELIERRAKQTSDNLLRLTGTTASTAQMNFIEAINKAYLETTTGVKSYSEAIKDAVKNMSKNGAEVLYPSGAKRSIESVARMNILTSTNQMSGQLQLQYGRELGWDLYEVSAHWGARPEHAEWQGKVYTEKELYDICGYGAITGLCGINCRHTFFPYYKGSSLANSKNELRKMRNATVSYNGRQIPEYQATQIQRQMERKIRQDKKELAGLEGILRSNNSEIETNIIRNNVIDTNAKIKEHTLILNEFLEQTQLRKDNNRLIIGTEMTKINKDDIIIKEIKKITGRTNAKIELIYDIPKDIEKYSIDLEHINTERGHNITKKEAIDFVNNSKIKMTVWQGRYENYYSKDGATYIDTKDKKIRTAFKKEEYEKSISDMMEVLNGRT